MDIEAARKEIGSRFKTLIADALSLPTMYDNQDTQEPESGDWCRLSILFGRGFLGEIGHVKRHRNVGVMVAQLFTPTGKGTASLMTNAKAIVDAFRDQSINGITYLEPAFIELGSEGKWYQGNVRVPWHTDEFVSMA